MASRKSGRDTDMEDFGNLDEQFKKLNLDEKRDINILLLGETGVGKSTFINAFCNYLQYSDLKYAMKGKLTTLIPTKFTITDENYEEQIVQVGEDKNEYVEAGVSATQASRSYVFPIRRGAVRIRLIDTPGVGDTRGIDQDNMNFENILSFISDIKHLNAICILLKPNNPRITVMFEFCIKQLLSRLEKSASRNLIFIFTNSRSTFYRPGETMPALKKLLEQVRSVNIPLHKDNIFCTDNEAFRFLAAVSNGIQFSAMDIDNFGQSWKKSVHECWRMISYITGNSNQNQMPLEPHQVKNTISINEARRLIVQLSQPLAEIAQLIQDNIYALQKHKMNLQRSNDNLTDLKAKLYVPVINLRVTKLDQPTTVCTSLACSTVYKVGDKNKWHYRQKCHQPCYLTNVPKEIIGSPELRNCAAMVGEICTKCQCRYQVHMHIYYETETYEDRQQDDAVKSEISTKEIALLTARRVIIQIERRVQELNQETETIIRTTAKFACFLKANAITPYNDAYQSYLKYLIDRERSMGDEADYDMIRQFHKMLQEYNEEKNVLNNAMSHSTSGTTATITADDIIQCVEVLYNLKHNGQKIQELFAKQKSARKDENQSETREYVFGGQQKKLKKRRNRNRNKNKSDNPAETTDSEYATDSGQRNPGRNQFNNRRNFVPRGQQQFNQRRGYHNYRPNQQHNAETASNQRNPLQYVHIKQGPSGTFDLRFGQSNLDPRGNNLRPSGSYQDLRNLNYGDNRGQSHQGTSSNYIPQQQRFRNHYPNSHSSNVRSHSPGRTYYNQRFQDPKTLTQGPFNPGPFNQGPFNQGPFNQGPFNQRPFNQGPFNQDLKGVNQRAKPFNQGFQFNKGPNHNQARAKYGQQPRNEPLSYDDYLKQNQGFKQGGRKTPVQSDSGYKSSTKEEPVSYGNAKRHCLDVSSDSSSLNSSEDEDEYMSCNPMFKN